MTGGPSRVNHDDELGRETGSQRGQARQAHQAPWKEAECFLDLLRSVFSHSKVRPHSLISQVRVLDRTTLPLLHWALFSIHLAICDKVLRPLMMKKLFVLCRQQKSWAIPSDVRHLEYILRQLRISWILPLACQHWQWFEYNTFYYAYPASPFIPCNTNM